MCVVYSRSFVICHKVLSSVSIHFHFFTQVAELVGIKTVVNEFVAYHSLGKLTKTRDSNEKLLEEFNTRMNESFSLYDIKAERNKIGKETGLCGS